MNPSFHILDWQYNLPAGVTRHYIEHSLGQLPGWISEDDPRPVWEQIDDSYPFGGWDPLIPSKTIVIDQNDILHFPGDPPMLPLATATCRDERVIVYAYGFVAIVQRNGDFSLARLD